MEFHLPIIDSTVFNGFGHWDRCRDCCPSLNLRGRHGLGLDVNVNANKINVNTLPLIPEAAQLGFGAMHLDDWLSPDELVGAIAILSLEDDDDDEKLMQFMKEKDSEIEFLEGNDVLEVNLNVSDYKTEELKVNICDGFVSIEGPHEEDVDMETEAGSETKSKEDKGDEVKQHILTHLKRTLTLPKNLLDNQLECKLTEDGSLLLHAPVKEISPSPEQIMNARVPIQYQVLKNKVEDRLAVAPPVLGEDQVDNPKKKKNKRHDHDQGKDPHLQADHHPHSRLSEWFLTLLSVF